MSLLGLSYSEYDGHPHSWTISDATFSKINLIVGKNSAGKSRLLSVIASYARVIAGKLPQNFLSGNFAAKIEINGSIFQHSVNFLNREITYESLHINGVEKFVRDGGGAGKIYLEERREFIDFQVPRDSIVAFSRRDGIQHPYLNELNQWAASVILYPFGSDFGRSRVLAYPEVFTMQQQAMSSPGLDASIDDPNDLVRAYFQGFNRFGEQFDKAIIEDMNSLGYKISDVGAKHLSDSPGVVIPAFGLFTVEEDLGFQNTQMNMSQGMFRALALSIQMNLCVFMKNRKLVLIDDIGEGLDFERSKSMINLLVKKASQSNMQIIMTSNDRFVMNEVPLEYWSILKRTGGNVRMFNARNSPDAFENFKYIGLNNFDFFASDFFDSGALN